MITGGGDFGESTPEIGSGELLTLLLASSAGGIACYYSMLQNKSPEGGMLESVTETRKQTPYLLEKK